MNVLLNGQLKGSEEAVISVFDHGFLYGMGLFETFRTYGGSPWLLDRHARRLAGSCRALGIVYEPDVEQLHSRITRLLEANGLGDAYLRWSVSAGEAPIGLPGTEYERPSEIIYAKELAADHPETRAAKIVRLLRMRRNSPEADVRLKSFHYMNNILAKRELTATGAASGTEGLFLSESGHVCEGIVSNVFWLSGGTLHTPALDTGPLPGVTRQFVIDLAARYGLRVREDRYLWDDVVGADEVFLTGSVQEIVPVAALYDENGRVVRRFVDDVGPVTRELMHDYRATAEGGEAG